MYIYIYIYIYTYIYIIYIHISMHVNNIYSYDMYGYMYMYVYVYIYLYIYRYRYIYLFIYWIICAISVVIKKFPLVNLFLKIDTVEENHVLRIIYCLSNLKRKLIVCLLFKVIVIQIPNRAAFECILEHSCILFM